MRRRGITLVELMVTMALGAVLLLVMTIQFVMNEEFQALVRDELAITQESEAAIYGMIQKLRFAIPDPEPPFGPPSNVDGSGNGYTSSITFTVEGGHISGIDVDTSVEYGFKNGNIEYISNTGDPNSVNSPVVIAKDISEFGPNANGPAWDPVNKNFTVRVSATRKSSNVTLNTTVYTLPNY